MKERECVLLAFFHDKDAEAGLSTSDGDRKKQRVAMTLKPGMRSIRSRTELMGSTVYRSC